MCIAMNRRSGLIPPTSGAIALSVAAVSSFGVASASADVITLNVLQDTMLTFNSSPGNAAPNDNFGARTTFETGARFTSSTLQVSHALLRLDPTLVPNLTLNTINSITLRLVVTSGSNSANGNTINLYQVAEANSGWVEGATATSGGSYTADDIDTSTWNSQISGGTPGAPAVGTAWAGSAGLNTAGVDYVNSVLASFTWTSTVANGTVVNFVIDDNTTTAAQRAAILASFSTGNEGFLLNSTNESLSANSERRLTFGSSENLTSSNLPSFIIDYTPIPEPGSLALLTAAGAMLLIKRRRTA